MKRLLRVILKGILSIVVLLIFASGGAMMWFNHTMQNMSIEERLQNTQCYS